jgi:parallel beta-helix repeat protein
MKTLDQIWDSIEQLEVQLAAQLDSNRTEILAGQALVLAGQAADLAALLAGQAAVQGSLSSNQTEVLAGQAASQSAIQGAMDTNQATTEAAVLAGQATSQTAIEAAIAAQPSDPRTPITSLPTTISQPGSYYLVGNLDSTGHGITIQASGVTLDLGGFSLTGDGDPGDYGIHVAGATNAPIENLVITGGRISGFFHGLYCQFMNNSRIEQMVVSGNANIGVYLNGGISGQCNGNTIANCTISGNTNYGVHLTGESGQCDGNTIANCTISGNTKYGVYLYGGGGGQCDGNTIRGNTISKNGIKGIRLYVVDGTRVEANHVWGTTGLSSYGIQTGSGTGNFILKNTCVGQVNNFTLDIDDTYGPVVSASGELDTTGAEAHPWANFSR